MELYESSLQENLIKMVGRNNAGNDRPSGSAGDGLFDDLKSKTIAALLAVILGGGGAAGYLNLNPPRPDPFTGTMGKEMEDRIDRRLDALESTQMLDNQHRQDAVDGYQRIRELEQRCERNANMVEALRDRVNRMERNK